MARWALVAPGVVVLAVLAAAGHEAQAAAVTIAAAIAAGVVLVRWVVLRQLATGGMFLLFGAVTDAFATAAWYLLPTAFGVRLPFPSFIDGIYLVSYSLYAAFLVSLLRAPGADVEESRIHLVDATIFTLPLILVVWELVLESHTSDHGVGAFEQVLVVAYPTVMAVAFALALRLALGRSSPGLIRYLLIMWSAFELVAAMSYGFSRVHGDFEHGQLPAGILRLASSAALVGLVLHPRLVELSRRSARSAGAIRLAALLPASLLPLALTVREASGSRILMTVYALVAGAVFTLVIIRLRLVAGDLEEQRRLAAALGSATQELRHQSLHDPLTGTGNRAMLLDRLDHTLARRSTTGKTNALLLLDLDSFKLVNDTMGHHAGDTVLQHVADRLNSNMRAGDTVARIGGDEFAVLLEDVTPSDALRATRRLVDAVQDSVEVAGRAVRTRASVGVYFASSETDPSIALRNADLAMYAAKDRGGGRYEVFEPGLHEAFVVRHQLELELRDAAPLGQLRLQYQPVIDLATGRIDGVEALVRWQHPTRGLVPPGVFMDIAEESGIIIDIGRWVFTTACRQLEAWRRHLPLPADFQMAVNLSRRQLLAPDLAEEFGDILGEAGAPASDLVVEVTETALMADTEELTRQLDQLSSLGLTIAMDDFGTGYSSLDQLRRLPIDILKIDRAFVEGIDRGPEDFALATAIVRLAASLGKETVAEGVETPAQLAHLRALRAGRAQGFLFARPMDEASLVEFIEAEGLAGPSSSGGPRATGTDRA